MFQFGRYLVR